MSILDLLFTVRTRTKPFFLLPTQSDKSRDCVPFIQASTLSVNGTNSTTRPFFFFSTLLLPLFLLMPDLQGMTSYNDLTNINLRTKIRHKHDCF